MKVNNSNNIKFSIIVPVYNESKSINCLIAHINSFDKIKNSEIIIVDGNLKKNTIKKIKDKKILKLSAEKGRAAQMNAGASAAKGEILIFMHADTRLPKSALAAVEKVFKTSKYAGGAFELSINSNNPLLKIIALGSTLRSRITRVPFGDQTIFIRKDYFKKIRGYKNIRIMEDVEIMKRIKSNKDKIKIINEKSLTSPRRWEEDGIFYVSFRNFVLRMLYLSGISPDTLVKYY